MPANDPKDSHAMSTNDPKDMSKNELVREVRRLRHLLSEQMGAAPGVGESVDVQGIVLSKNREPVVRVRAGEASWDWALDQAREHALDVLAAATEADRDAATIAFLESGDFDRDTAGAFLAAMREHRAVWKGGRPA